MPEGDPSMIARVLVVVGLPDNVKLLEAASFARIF